MARYVIANRRAGKFVDTEKRAARSAMDRSVSAVASAMNVLADQAPSDETKRRVMLVEADPKDIAAMPKHPDVLVEPEILHYRYTAWPTEFLRAGRSVVERAPAGSGNRMHVVIRGNGQPLRGTTVMLFLRSGSRSKTLEQVTGEDGTVDFSFSTSYTAAALIAIPAGNFWVMVVRGPAKSVTIDCIPLPPGPLGWWHQAFSAGGTTPQDGTGIRVGVADTGCGPHPALSHVIDGGAFLRGKHQPAPAGRDVDSHGSHVSGTIGARPTDATGYIGIARGADLICVRIFPDADSGANQGDIANAIDYLSAVERADLINLSLGAPVGSQIEHDAIIDAYERGTLCVCAAGNEAGPVGYPAAFPECAAISALGQLGTTPEGSLSATRVPAEPDRFGDDNLYLASFSCYGPQVAAAGTGVGIISTVPERYGLAAPYGVMDGTSMASPSVCGALAVLLGRSPAYLASSRDQGRADLAKQILRQNARDIGLASIYQGAGLPRL